MLSENPNIARRGYFGFVMPEHNQHTSAGGVDIGRLTKPSCAFYRERHKWALECATHRWYTLLMVQATIITFPHFQFLDYLILLKSLKLIQFS
jgi:hypothetical protein